MTEHEILCAADVDSATLRAYAEECSADSWALTEGTRGAFLGPWASLSADAPEWERGALFSEEGEFRWMQIGKDLYRVRWIGREGKFASVPKVTGVIDPDKTERIPRVFVCAFTNEEAVALPSRVAPSGGQQIGLLGWEYRNVENGEAVLQRLRTVSVLPEEPDAEGR